MKLNVSKALTAEAERKAKPVPIPTIRRKTGDVSIKKTVDSAQSIEILQQDLTIHSGILPDSNLIQQLEAERHSLMLDRKKLSTKTAKLVEEIQQRLKVNEGAAAAAEFIKGNMPVAELRDHYSRIQDFTDKLIRIYDRIEYVKQNGKLPDQAPGPELLPAENQDVATITWEIRRLDDLIYKLSKKLEQANSGIKKPKNSERTNTWRTTMAMAEAKRDELKLKRKQLRRNEIN